MQLRSIWEVLKTGEHIFELEIVKHPETFWNILQHGIWMNFGSLFDGYSESGHWQSPRCNSSRSQRIHAWCVDPSWSCARTKLAFSAQKSNWAWGFAAGLLTQGEVAIWCNLLHQPIWPISYSLNLIDLFWHMPARPPWWNTWGVFHRLPSISCGTLALVFSTTGSFRWHRQLSFKAAWICALPDSPRICNSLKIHVWFVQLSFIIIYLSVGNVHFLIHGAPTSHLRRTNNLSSCMQRTRMGRFSGQRGSAFWNCRMRSLLVPPCCCLNCQKTMCLNDPECALMCFDAPPHLIGVSLVLGFELLRNLRSWSPCFLRAVTLRTPSITIQPCSGHSVVISTL